MNAVNVLELRAIVYGKGLEGAEGKTPHNFGEGETAAAEVLADTRKMISKRALRPVRTRRDCFWPLDLPIPLFYLFPSDQRRNGIPR